MPSPRVDFIAGAVAHRRKYGGGKGQMIAKAVGIKPGVYPSVLDLTAGLGKDAFVLATLGCVVTLVERNAIVFSALQKGMEDAQTYAQQEDPALTQILARMHLIQRDSLDYLTSHTPLMQQVIYLDPMFPERKKSAAVKKDMILLQQLVGDDPDSDELFLQAMKAGAHRVVVKRPRIAPCLADQKPSLVFEGNSSRFDVYPLQKLA
jgi:16S rRNA (guanine1516-N2)-methyltransferase